MQTGSAESRTGEEPLADLAERVLAKSRLTEIPFDYEYDTWVLHPDSMRFLVALTRELRPRTVIEFGSGLSTRVLAQELAAATIRSFDHSPVYAQRTRDAVGDAARDVEVLYRPIALRLREGKLLPFYRVRAGDFAATRDADLVLVDGPPGSWGREAALYAAWPHMRTGGVLVLDDAARPGERAAADAWRRRFGAAVDMRLLESVGKGVLLVRKRAAAPQGAAFAVAERGASVRRALHAVWRHRPGRKATQS